MRRLQVSSAKLRTIQVGLGGWGRDWAKRVVPQIEAVQLVAYVEPDPSSLELVTGDAPRFTSFDDAVAAVEADAVLVTAAVAAHVPVVRQALEAGKHVLVEKPFAPTVEEGQALVELAKQRNLTLMVSQNYRFFPAPRAVRELVVAGELGALHHIDLEFRQHSVHRPGRPSPHHAYAQPLLDDMSIHHFDLLRFITGESPESVFCQTWNPSWSGFSGPPAASAVMTFGGDISVSYRGSWVSHQPATPWAGEWRMAFEKGDITWTSRGANDTAEADEVSVITGDETRRLELTQLTWTDRWGTLSEFADAVLAGREPQCTGLDNLGSLALRSGAIDSADRRAVVNFD
jgi:predicted dehydrogenase